MTSSLTDLFNTHVSLSGRECDFDRHVASLRMDDVRTHGRRNAASLAGGDDEMSNHVIGVHGEHAFAKWLGVERQRSPTFGRCEECRCYIGTVNTFKIGGDVGAFQVRTSRYLRARLLVRERDCDTDIFVLVVPRHADTIASWRMVGWLEGASAKRYEWRDDPGKRGAAYLVPQERLQLMIALPR